MTLTGEIRDRRSPVTLVKSAEYQRIEGGECHSDENSYTCGSIDVVSDHGDDPEHEWHEGGDGHYPPWCFRPTPRRRTYETGVEAREAFRQ